MTSSTELLLATHRSLVTMSTQPRLRDRIPDMLQRRNCRDRKNSLFHGQYREISSPYRV